MIKSFKGAFSFLLNAPKTKADVFKGEDGFEKSKEFFKLLGNPQNLYPTIHIAGTSGKGTVAHMIASILTSHSRSNHTLVSPHVYSLKERILIDSKQISEKDFVKALNSIIPVYEKLDKENQTPTYFETLLAMGFVSANSPEYMVVETGLGGLLDTTNTIDRKDKICVITPIGFDHMHILGNTLEEIAGQKAGIIQENQVVITCNQDPKVMRVIQERVRQKKAKLLVVDSLDLDIPNTQLVGEYNKVNLSLALAVCIVLSKRDGWDLDIYKALEAINSMVIPGRREVIKKSKTWIFDGAHNPQKMKALASTVDNVGVILAVKEGYKELIKILKPHAKEIILTKHLSPESDQPIKDISPSSEYRFFADQEELIRYVKSSKIQTWLVTGSFFILKEIRDRI